MPKQICLLKNISKRFNGIPVINQLSIELYEGEIHAIIGDSGVGKSTLMRILAGYIPLEDGEVYIDGNKVPPYNQFQAPSHGIIYIAPDTVCVPDMTVLENVFLGDYPRYPHLRILDHPQAAKQARAAFDLLGFQPELDQPLGTLGTAERKLVLLASILCHKPKILILDEVALGLGEYELRNFYQELVELKKQGVSIFLVTQDLKKVFDISDQITMISKGSVVWSQRNSKEFYEEICDRISLTIEKSAYPKLPARIGEEVLRTEQLSNSFSLDGVNLNLHKGEIVGVLGVAGSGRTSLARCLFGLDASSSGSLYLYGKPVRIRNAAMANKYRMGFMEELANSSLVYDLNCVENITLANIKGISHLQLLDLKLEKRSAAYYLKRLRIDERKWTSPVKELSRGEQQKILIAKWLFSNARILLLDEPTIGLDISSRIDVYNLMSELAYNGLAFLVLSSDIGELAGMCDRVYIMCDGCMVRELSEEELTVPNLIRSLATN